MELNKLKTIDIEFEVPFQINKIFDFVAASENMSLYKGYGLIPGIAKVQSSNVPRIQGTVDFITNTDGSSHKSTTSEFVIPSKYFVEISDINVQGFKRHFSKTILGFSEEWNYFSAGEDRTKIHRRLSVKHKTGWIHEILLKLLVLPNLEKSLHLHHSEIIKRMVTLSSAGW